MAVFFEYDFLRNALFIGMLMGILLPIIGIVVLHRRMIFIADALGHMNMSAIAFSIYTTSIFASLTTYSSLITIIWTVAGAVLIEFLRDKFKAYKEVSIMLVSSFYVAMTMVFLSLSSGYNSSLFNILFGNINSVSTSQLWTTVVFTIAIVIIISLNYRKLLLFSLEEEYAKLYGVNYKFWKYFSIIIIAFVISFAIKIIGVLLVTSLLTIPILAAGRISTSLKKTFITSIIFTEISIVGGYITAYYLNISSSSIIVLFAIAIYCLTFLKNNNE